MSITSDLTMAACIDLLGLRTRYTISDRASNNVCPVCGDSRNPRKKKLNINFQKGTFRCNKCGFSGGILDFWAYHRDIPREDAWKDYWKVYHGIYDKKDQNGKVRVPPKTKVLSEQEIPLDFDRIDKTYREFLNMLCLSKEHYENLKGRGLSDKAIKEGLYKTVPLTAVKAIPAKLIEKGYDLKGIPGFYKEKGIWKFLRYGDGFLIPSITTDGKICSLQLRKDNSSNGPRYMTVSTDGYEEGTKGVAFPSFNPGNGDFSKVIITEGALKGNIIACLSGYPVVSVLGVNSTGSLPDILKTLQDKGTSQLKIAFDMDYIGNKHVEEACDKLEEMIYRLGFRYSRLVWDPDYKGLDDYLAAHR